MPLGIPNSEDNKKTNQEKVDFLNAELLNNKKVLGEMLNKTDGSSTATDDYLDAVNARLRLSHLDQKTQEGMDKRNFLLGTGSIFAGAAAGSALGHTFGTLREAVGKKTVGAAKEGATIGGIAGGVVGYKIFEKKLKEKVSTSAETIARVLFSKFGSNEALIHFFSKYKNFSPDPEDFRNEVELLLYTTAATIALQNEIEELSKK